MRRRQNQGVEQIADRYPHLMKHEDKGAFGKSQVALLALSYPFGFFVYAMVALIVRLTKAQSDGEWSRGR